MGDGENIGAINIEIAGTLEELSKAVDKAKGQLTNLEKFVDKVSTSTSKIGDAFADGMRQSGQFMEDVAMKAGKVFGAITNPLTLAVGAAAGLGLGLKKLGDVVMTVGPAFDTAMANVSTLVNTAEVDMQALGDGVVSMTTQVNKSAVDLAGGLYQTISAGISAGDSLGFLEVAAKAATAGLSDTRTSVDGLSSVVNAFGLRASDVGRIADQMFTAVTRGKTTFPEIATAIGLVAPIAAAAKVSTGELFAAITTLTSGGLGTSEAMTSLKAALSNIIKPSTEAKDLASSLGIQFDAQSLQAQGLAGFLDQVKTATGGNVDTLAKLFGSVEAVNAILSLTGPQAEKFKADLEAMGAAAGATDTAFEKIRRSFEEVTKSLRLAVEGVALKLFAQLKPGLIAVANAASVLVPIIGGLLSGALRIIGGLVREVVGFFVTFKDIITKVAIVVGVTLVAYALGSLAAAIPGMITSIASLAAKFVLWAAGAWSTAAATIAAAAPTIGLGLAIVALVAIIITLVMTFRELVQTVTKVFWAIKTVIVAYVNMWINLFKNLGRMLKGVFTLDPKEIKAGFDGAKSEIVGFKDVVVDQAKVVGGALMDYGKVVVANVRDTVAGARDAISGGLSKMGFGSSTPAPLDPGSNPPPDTTTPTPSVDPEEAARKARELDIAWWDYWVTTGQKSRAEQLQHDIEYYQGRLTAAKASGKDVSQAELDLANAELALTDYRKQLTQDEFDFKVQMGQLTLQDQLAVIDSWLAGEKEGSDRWRELMLKRKQLSDQITQNQLENDQKITEQREKDFEHLEKIIDNTISYEYQTGQVSLRQYLTYLKGKQSALEEFSDEWIALDQRIRDMEKQLESESLSWFQKLGAGIRDQLVGSITLGKELWTGITTGNWVDFAVGLVTSTESFQNVVDQLNGVMEQVIGIVNTLLEPLIPLIEGILAAIQPVLGLLAEFAVALADMITPIIGPLVEVITMLFEALTPIIDLVLNIATAALKPFMSWLVILVKLLKPVISVITAVLLPIINFITGLWNAIMTALASIDIFGWHPFGEMSEYVVDTGDSGGGSPDTGDKPSGAGTQVSQLSGPAQDLFTKLLTPLTSLPVLVGAMNTVRDAVLQAYDVMVGIVSVLTDIRAATQTLQAGLVGMTAAPAVAGAPVQAASGTGNTYYQFLGDINVERLENEQDMLKLMQQAKSKTGVTITSGGGTST